MLWQLLHVSDLEVVDGYGAVDGGRQEVPALDCVQVQPEQPSPRPSGLRCLDDLCAAELEAEGPVAGENTRRRGLADEGKGLSIYRGNVDINASAGDAQFPACDGPHCYPFCIGKPIRTEPSQSRNPIGNPFNASSTGCGSAECRRFPDARAPAAAFISPAACRESHHLLRLTELANLLGLSTPSSCPMKLRTGLGQTRAVASADFIALSGSGDEPGSAWDRPMRPPQSNDDAQWLRLWETASLGHFARLRLWSLVVRHAIASLLLARLLNV